MKNLIDKLLKNKTLLYIVIAAVVTVIIAVIVLCASMNRYTFVLNDEGDGYTITNYDGWASKITLPEKHKGLPVVAVGDNAFANEGMNKIVLSKNIVDVGYQAFANCENLTEIKLNDGLKHLGVAFVSDCQALQSVVVPDSVEVIRPGTFNNNNSLVSVKLPKSLKTIHYMAFLNCSSVCDLSIGEGAENFKVQNNCVIETATGTVVLAVSGATIPDDGSVTAIGEGAFMGLTGIRFLTIPESVTHIGSSAFEGCPMLQSVEMKGVKTIGQRAFLGCTILSDVVIGNELSEVGSAAFENCPALKNVYFLGNSAEFTLAIIGDNNAALSADAVYFYSESQPDTEGRFWHYNATEKPVKW